MLIISQWNGQGQPSSARLFAGEGTSISDHTLGRLLSAGGQAVVFRSTCGMYVIKIFQEKATCVHEANIHKCLMFMGAQHNFTEFVTVDAEKHAIVQRYCTHRTLLDVLLEVRAHTRPCMVLPIACQMCSGCAHSDCLPMCVHRAHLKVMVSPSRVARLTFFANRGFKACCIRSLKA